MNQHDKFKVFIDADIVKGNSEGEMRIRGIASDNNKDRQGEYLDPSTMDLSDFDFINWNHKGKDDPSCIIGYPDKSKVKVTDDNELYIEGVLHNNVPMAKATFNLMNALQKSPGGKRLGMSVEGMVIERDPSNPNKITKSKITGVAICPVPVNGSTWTELIQKGFTDESDPIYDNETLLLEQELEKAISIESTTDSQENTGVDRKIEKESIDGATPKKKKKKKNLKEVVDNEVENSVTKNELSKAEVYEKIFNYFYINDLQKAKQIFNIVTKISQMDKKEITDETINKALSILDIANEVVTTNEVEVNSNDEVVEKSEEVTLEKAQDVIVTDDIEKAFKKEDKKSEDEDDDKDSDDKKDKKDKPKFKDEVYKAAKCEADEMKKDNKNKDDIKKALIDGGYSENLADVVCADIDVVVSEASIQKSQIEDLMKSQVNELSDIIKSYNTSLEGKITSFESIAKSSETKVEELAKSLNTLMEENKTLQSRLENIEKTPMGTKSIISKSFVDRFESVKKGEEIYQLGLKKDRLALIEKAFDLGQAKGDEDLIQAALNLEATGQLTPRNITKLSTVGIHVV